VSALTADDGTDDRAPIHSLRELWKDFTDLDAGHVRGDGAKLSADLARGVGLQIPKILMGRATCQKDVDERLMSSGTTGCRSLLISPQDRSEREPTHPKRQPSDRQEIPAGWAATKVLVTTEY
jgi:hypothetical protein